MAESLEMLYSTSIIAGFALALWSYYSFWKKSGRHSAGFSAWLKWNLALIYLSYKKWKVKKIFDHMPYGTDICQTGISATDEEWFYEKPRMLHNDTNAGDSVKFWGIDNNGNALMTHLTRRHCRISEVCIYLKLQSGDEYQAIVHPDMQLFNVDHKRFSAGGLTFEIMDPMRTWRIVFRGVLRKGIKNDWNQDDEENVAVNFTFMWHAGYHPFVLQQDFNSAIFADAISKTKWNSSFLFNHSDIISWDQHEQWGQMFGEVQIEHCDDLRLNLWGPKIRTNGICDWETKKKELRMHLHTKNGAVVSLEAYKSFRGVQNIVTGYVIPAHNLGLDTIANTEFDYDTVFQEKSISSPLFLKLKAGNDSYTININSTKNEFRVFGNENWKCEISNMLISGTMNGNEFYGFMEICQPFHGKCPITTKRSSLPLLQESFIENCKTEVLKLDAGLCQCGNLVGGKCTSLALMRSIKDSPEKFEVPNGICLTKNAFLSHSASNPEIGKLITELESVAWKKVDGCLKTQCEKLVDVIISSGLCEKNINFIRQGLQEIFGNDFEKFQFAVRSSAIGEDGEEMSAAGQNETFLGVCRMDNICEAVIKCWASQFAFRSVEYKRQHGQLLNAGMGVVIQQMVPSDISGVMFTGDPVTGGYGFVTLSANFGLGESVVSAKMDPDTIILQRRWDDKLTLQSKQIGKKQLKITLKANGGTEVETNSPNDATLCCLSDNMAIKLGNLAIFLEQSFGNPRDIEWSIHNGHIYLLQCRPITFHLGESQYEITHEMDNPRNTDTGFYTRANIGEVCPGAVSPLCGSTLWRIFRVTGEKTMVQKLYRLDFNPFLGISNGMASYCNHYFNDEVHQKLWTLAKEESPSLNALKLGTYGHIMDDREVHETALKRYPLPGFWTNIRGFYNFVIKSILLGKRSLNAAMKKYENYTIPYNGVETIEEFHQKIEDQLFDTDDALLAHMKVSSSSLMWNLIVLSSLAGSTNEYSLDHYNDFANLIGKGNGAISGDVPFSLKELAKIIAKEKNPEEFTTMSSEDALHWLKLGTTLSCLKFQEFLRKHGHRCYHELELKSMSWAMDPIKLIKVLQRLVPTVLESKTDQKIETIEETIANLKTTVTPMKRRILSLVLPMCRSAVARRELSKSTWIKVIDGIRMAYRKLGELMVHEGYLSDSDLIFFLTNDEIKQLVRTRSARLINRVLHRHRIFAKVDLLHFRQFIRGDPQAIEEENQTEDKLYQNNGNTSIQIHAYPVCKGNVTGPARVIINFAEVDQIQAGDILITNSTDIAWSPYFPLLGGVVTEIGGLVSHGAVVAREYGLPCIVAAEGATKIFKTGDMVHLDASKGTLEKIT